MNEPPKQGQKLVLPEGVQIAITTQESTEAAQHRRWRETALFAVSLLLFVLVFVTSLWFAFVSTQTDAESRKAAIGIVITLSGGLAGFLGGRAAK